MTERVRFCFFTFLFVGTVFQFESKKKRMFEGDFFSFFISLNLSIYSIGK